ncbi:MAG: hypothetical protein IJS45_03440 [Clostridia bacterium]|nr:hypothetical protein [Clostridia bacterium]
MDKKVIPISVIVDAIEETFEGWQQYYNVVSGEVESVPDSDSYGADMSEYEELCEKIDSSDEYVRLPSQYDLHEYSIMEDFAEEKNDERLFRALRGRRPFRNFKDTAENIGLIEEYYRFRTEAFTDIARRWCRDNDIPFTEPKMTEEQTVTITVKTKGEVCEMSTAEIKAWYEEKVAGLFNPEFGTPEITVNVKRKKRAETE